MGARFNVSITWRKSLFTASAIDTLVRDLEETICSWVSQAPELHEVYEPAA
jgi:hypothetical protein